MDQIVHVMLKKELNGSTFQFLFPNNCKVDDLKSAALDVLSDVLDIIKQHAAAQEASQTLVSQTQVSQTQLSQTQTAAPVDSSVSEAYVPTAYVPTAQVPEALS